MNTRILLLSVGVVVVVVGLVYSVVPSYIKNLDTKTNPDAPLTTKDTSEAGAEVSKAVSTSTGTVNEKENDSVAAPASGTTVIPSAKVTPVDQPSALYTTTTVATHNSVESCWTIINGKVYDLTPFISRHPGGEKNILKVCGIDGTVLFENQHEGASKPESKLQSLFIGILSK